MILETLNHLILFSGTLQDLLSILQLILDGTSEFKSLVPTWTMKWSGLYLTDAFL